MAAINFPDSPTSGDIVVRGGFSWQYNGTVWKKILVAGTALPDGTNNLDLIKWNSSTEGWEADSQANVIGTYVSSAVNAVIDSAPEALNTLNELAAALDDDANFATTVTTALSGKASTSHTHAISDVTNLQTSLDAKASTGKAIAMAMVFG